MRFLTSANESAEFTAVVVFVVHAAAVVVLHAAAVADKFNQYP